MPKSLSRRSAFDALLILLTFSLIAGCASVKDGTRAPVSWVTAMVAVIPPNVTPKEDLSRPAVFDDTLYIGSSLGVLHAVSLSSGRTLWTYDAKCAIDGAPTVSGDAVFLGTRDGSLVSLDKKTGKENWRFQARSSVLSSPAVHGGRLYLTSADDRLYALDAKTGEKLWSYTRGSFQTVAPRLFSSPVIAASNLCSLFTDGSVACFAPDTGKELWSRKIVKNFDATDVKKRALAVADSQIYLLDDTNSVVAIDALTGEQKSSFNLIKAHDFTLAEKGGKKLLVVADSTQVVAVDRGTGAILWKKELSHTPVECVYSANGSIFALSNFSYAPYNLNSLSRIKGHIEALDPADGSPLWGETLEHHAVAAVPDHGARVVVLVDYGILQVLESI